VALLLLLFFPALAEAQALNRGDLDKISQMIAVFTKLTSDAAESFKRPDISRDESDCIKNTWQELNQTSEELSSYMYLIDIVSGMDDFSDYDAMRGFIRSALDKAIQVLETERRRLTLVSDQCLRFPTSVGISERALQFMDGATAALRLILPRV
jgi:hypothetical protein